MSSFLKKLPSWWGLFEDGLFKKLLVPFVVCSFVFWSFNLSLGVEGFYFADYLVCLLFSYALFAVSKDNLYYIVNVFFLILVFYVINRLKIQYFGQPVMASDILSIIALYDVQSEWVKNIVLGALVVSLLGLFLNLKYTKKSIVTIIVVFLLFPLGYVSTFAGYDCNENEVSGCGSAEEGYSGSSLHYFANSLAELKDELVGVPQRVEVDAAKRTLAEDKWLYQYSNQVIKVKRNVHIILVESLWDPLTLKQVDFSSDPFDASFRALWESGGRSVALSPVFGGGTANAEFELLCGMPVTTNVIKFELPVLNTNLPCLPELLHSQGYESVASHPNVRGFWNRDSAYPKIGFNRYYSLDDFIKDDMVSDTYLSDESLFRQTSERLSKIHKPVLNYVLTASEHYPYANLEEGGEVEVLNIDNDYFKRYVNLIRRGTGELYQYYRQIRKTDPEAIVVVLGDHLPLFGRQFSVYRDVGLLGEGSKDEPQHVVSMHATPLIFVNGGKGVVRLGEVPIYHIPVMITQALLGDGVGKDSLNQGLSNTLYRPLPNLGVLRFDKKWMLCKRKSPNSMCRRYLHDMDSMTALVKDIVIGDRISLLHDDVAR